MSSPMIARNAVLWDGTAPIGFCREVRWSDEADAIKDYKTDSDKPAILESGNKTYKVSFRRFYIDKTYAEKVSSGTKFASVEIRPAGTGVGKEKITFSNLLLLKFEGSWASGGILYESVEGEAMDIAFGTQ